MNMFARFVENPAMTLQDIKETKRSGRTDGRTHARTDNVKTVYPPQTKFAGGYNDFEVLSLIFGAWYYICCVYLKLILQQYGSLKSCYEFISIEKRGNNLNINKYTF